MLGRILIQLARCSRGVSICSFVGSHNDAVPYHQHIHRMPKSSSLPQPLLKILTISLSDLMRSATKPACSKCTYKKLLTQCALDLNTASPSAIYFLEERFIDFVEVVLLFLAVHFIHTLFFILEPSEFSLFCIELPSELNTNNANPQINCWHLAGRTDHSESRVFPDAHRFLIRCFDLVGTSADYSNYQSQPNRWFASAGYQVGLSSAFQ